jgi:hypothetical protein
MKDLIESIRQMYQPRTEATMMKNSGEVVHNCAKHVEHAQYGKGNTIAEEHADPDRYGNIAWYDVVFEHGVEKGVPVSELSILQSESHGHTTKKAKKMSEAEDLSMDRKKFKANMEDDDENEEEDDDDMEDDDKPMKGKKKVEEASDFIKGMKRMVAGKKSPSDVRDAHLAKATFGANPKVKEKEGRRYDKVDNLLMKKEDVDFPIAQDYEQDLPESVDEIVIYKTQEFDLAEAKKSSGYDAHFRAMMTKHGVKHPGELDTPEKKKAFFNKVDASYKAKNEDVFLEAMMASDLDKIKDAHKKAGNKISNETSGSKAGQAHHSFVVTQPSGKRTRHIYHGSTKKLETMSPAARSKESAEQDLDDK